MLHLAIIGIVCAVFAPNEGTTFIGQKNYEFNTFCFSEEGKETIAKVIFPYVYIVDHNSSDCAKTKIANRTNLPFYDCIIKQYQSSRKNSCSIVENVALESEKNFRSNVDFTYRKRNLLWNDNKSAASKDSFENEKHKNRKLRKIHWKFKGKKKKKVKDSTSEVNNSGLTQQEKRLFLNLKRLRTPNPGHLYIFGTDADFESRIQKLSEKMSIGNQKEKEITKTNDFQQNKKTQPQNFKKSFLINNNLRKKISLENHYSRFKNYDIDSKSGLFSVNFVRNKNPAAEKTDYINMYDVPKITYKSTKNSESKKLLRKFYSNTEDLRLMYNRNLIPKPYPYRPNFKAKFNILYPINQKFMFKSNKKRHHRAKLAQKKSQDMKNLPFFNKFQYRSQIYRVRQRHCNEPTSTDKPTKNEAGSSFAYTEILQKIISEKPSEFSMNPVTTEKIMMKESDVKKTNVNINLSSLNRPAETKDSIIENLSGCSPTQKDEKYVPDHTIEKPFLESDSKREYQNQQIQYADFKQSKADYNPSFSFFGPSRHQFYRQNLYKLFRNGCLTASHYLKVRHALRAYLTRNNLWKAPKRTLFSSKRKKRHGGKSCSTPQKCWRTPPLLCIPYIKKGQQDVLKYLLKVIEKMIGKPFPPKSDIFGKTKFKPSYKKQTENAYDDSNDNDIENIMTENSLCIKPPLFTSPPSQIRSTQELNSTTPFSITTKCTSSASCVTSSPMINPPSVTNSWLPSVTIFVPRPDEIQDQKLNQYNEKISQDKSQFSDQLFRLTPPPVSTVSAPLSSPLPSTSIPPSEKTATPVFSNSATSNSSVASFPTSTIAPVQGVTETVMLTTFQEAPFVSTVNSCKLFTSSSLVNQEKYYSFTPHSYNALPEYCRIKPYECFKDITPNPIKLEPTISSCNQKKSELIDCDASYKNVKNVSPNIQETRQWQSKTKPTPFSSSDITFQDQDQYQFQAEKVKHNFEMPEEPLSEYPFELDHFRKNEKSQNSKKRFSKKKKFHFNDYFLNKNHIPYQDMKYGILKRKLFKMSHPKSFFKQNLRLPLPEPNPFIDYYSYDKYPFPILDEMNKINFEKLTTKMRNTNSQREKYLEMKGIKKLNSLARWKREDNYVWPKIYSNCVDDSNYKGENVKKNPEFSNDNNPDPDSDLDLDFDPDSDPESNPDSDPDSNPNPPSYEMFCELAKALTDYNTTEQEPTNTTTSETTDNYTTTAEALDLKNIHQTTSNRAMKLHYLKTTQENEETTSQIQTTTHRNPVEQNEALQHLTTTLQNETTLLQNLTATLQNETKKIQNLTGTLQNETMKFQKLTVSPENLTPAYQNLTMTPQNKTTPSQKLATTTEIPQTTVPQHTVLTSQNQYTFSTTTPLQNKIVTIQNLTSTLQNETFTIQNLTKTLQNETTTLQKLTVTPQDLPATFINPVGTNQKSDNCKNGNEKSLLPGSDNFSKEKNLSQSIITTHNFNSSYSFSDNAEFMRKKNAMNSGISKTMDRNRCVDYIKSERANLFQTNSKTNLTNSQSSTESPKNLKKDSEKEDKELKENEDIDNGEGQVPTTLKAAIIVKGSKKLLAKPSPKIYSKVYPDFLDFEFEVNDTVATTTAVTTKPCIENKTALLSSTLKPDVRLQLLAVCEGYLEIIKRIKAQNQTFGEDLDAQLARYCESIISQSFNTQLEKPKKVESGETTLQITTSSSAEDSENNSKTTSEINTLPTTQAAPNISENGKGLPKAIVREKVLNSTKNQTKDSVSKKVNDKKNANGKLQKQKKFKKINEEQNWIESSLMKTSESKKKKSRKKKHNYSFYIPLKEEIDEQNNKTEDGILKKGETEEQVKLIHLLKKRKRALMSWLINSKDQYKMDDLPETDYFDDEDFLPPDADFSEYSGTIKPKRNDKNLASAKEGLYCLNETIFPVYAKQYGYDKGGELREVEVLWRKVNEKTHEEKILKNMSLIAFLMVSTNTPNKNYEEIKLLGNKEYEGENSPETEMKNRNKAGFDVETVAVPNTTPSIVPKSDRTKLMNPSIPNAKGMNSSNVTSATRSLKKNATYTFINKPDPSSIVGTPPNQTKGHQNITRKTSHKFAVAKDLFQEYSIEFLNYAVYILPAMFTILFLFCCFGCALYILKSRKSFKKCKKKKKKPFSTDESSETTEESESTRKKRKREAKRKKKAGSNAEDEEKRRKKKFWNVLRMSSKTYREPSEENGQSEKKNFLRFLKGKRGESKANECNKFSKNYADSGDERTCESDRSLKISKKEAHKINGNSDAAERRELISLLEELKKIELGQLGDKKEVKSVHVQYMTQEDENPVHQRPLFSYPYEKNVFGLPKGYFFCTEKFPYQRMNPVLKEELCEDVSETSELLPCDCNYYSEKSDCLRHCDFKLSQDRCKHFFKIFRGSTVNQNKSFRDKSSGANESVGFILNKCKSINTSTNKELVGVTYKNSGTEVKLTDNVSPFTLSTKENEVKETENLNQEFSKKKYVCLKDDGVFCRL